MAIGFVKYISHTGEILVTRIWLAQKMKFSTQSSFSHPESACSLDEVQEVTAVPTSNRKAQVLARQSKNVTKDHTNNIVEAPRVIRLPATKFSLHLLLPSNRIFIVADTLPEEEFGEPEIEKPSVK